MAEEIKGYPEQWVWAACAHVYGGGIAQRTWTKYKFICQVPRRKRLGDNLISKTHCQWLLMLAYIRFEQRSKGGSKPPAGQGTGVTLHQIVKRLNSSSVMLANLDRALGDAIIIEGVKGSDVPVWLHRCVGKSRSIPTLRRWAKKYGLKFSVHLPVSKEVLDKFLQLA